MKGISLALVAGSLLLPAGLLAQSPSVAPGAAVLSPGDAVQITVWRNPELSGEFQIGADSTIQHPLYHAIKVAGVPIPVAEERVRTFLQTLQTTPQFVMRPLFRVAVTGEVRQPNLYTLPPSVTIAEAVVRAGGITERGRLNRVKLVRDGEVAWIDLSDPHSAMAQSPIHSGDQITVERKTSFFRDYIVPAASVTAAIGTIVNILRN